MFANVWAVATAEMRSTRRLARYWVFAVLAVLISFIFYMQYAVMHGLGSHLSATVGTMGPRYLVSAIGLYVVILFLVGLVFLAFDVRARDIRERMVEVLDVRPLRNAEFLIGRGLGLVLMSVAPLIFVAIVIQGFGTLAGALEWPIGERVEPYSLVDFIIHSVTMFAWWCSIVMLLSVLVRNRLIVAIGALAIFGAYMWASTSVPIYLQSIFGLFFGFAFASDLVPTLVPLGGFLPRIAIWCMTIGFIALAVAWHPRRDDAPKARTLGIGGAAVALGIVAMLGQSMVLIGDVELRAEWMAAHAARQADPRLDVLDVDGAIAIDPGDELVLDYALRVVNSNGEALEALVFSFNPGFEIGSIRVAGSAVDWTFDAGLLEIDQRLSPGAETTVEIVARGAPDLRFGFLDASIDLNDMSMMDSQLFILGTDNGVFDSRYVGLLAGLRWLPKSGSDVPTSDTREHPTDFFAVDLTVDIPEGWLIAGPGRRESIGSTRFRFAPNAPVNEVGLFASEFERRAIDVDGIEFEILVSPDHDRNLVLFEGVEEALRGELREYMKNAADVGLRYPYGSLALVEVPINLRSYGGGWRLDSILSTPGVLLAKESSFPTARFDNEFRNPEEFDELEGGIEAAKIATAAEFFENDFSGGNVFLGGSRNFFGYQTSATGPGAIALNFIIDELTSLLVTDTRGYFSAHEFNADSGLIVGEIMQSMFGGETESIAQAMVDAASDRPAIWDRAISTPLVDIEPMDDPKETLNLLALKGRAIAQSIVDGVGDEKVGEILRSLLENYRGSSFTVDEFDAVAALHGVDFSNVIGDWLNDTGMPGFITSSVSIERLRDDELGNPRYQTRFHVRNDEATPGLFKVRYGVPSTENEDQLTWRSSDPHWIDGDASLEVGLYGWPAPRDIRLTPYFALNRQEISLPVPAIDDASKLDKEAFFGARESDWQPRDASRGDIVIDDLDPGFVVEDDDPRPPVPGGFNFGLTTPRIDMDQGLPEFRSILGSPLVWSRTEDRNAHGKYRRTTALVQGGTGLRRAVFNADIPAPGRYRLSYHLPEQRSTNVQVTAGAAVTVTSNNSSANRLGVQDIRLEIAGDDQAIEFDGSAASPGWNDLGDFSLPRGSVRLTISDETTGQIVVADAIRWRPLG